MIKFTKIFFLMSIFFCSFPIRASDMHPSCLQSFNVIDKTFSSNAISFSCRTLESRRVELFQSINNLDESGNIDTTNLTEQIASLERKLKANEDQKNWAGWSINLTGNFLSTLSLASCATTTPCTMAIIGKILSLVGIIEAGSSENDKVKSSKEARETIEAIKEELRRINNLPVIKLRESLINEFNQLCSDVKNQCLTK